MLSKNIIGIGQLTLTVAWMLGSATIWIFKDWRNALGFMVVGLGGIIILRLIEVECYKSELHTKRYT